MEEKSALKFFFELGMLRRVDREGWKLAGIEDPENVAEHTLRTAQIAFVLAKMEGLSNPTEAATIAIFHDMAECRIGDFHKIANRYCSRDQEKVVSDQTSELGEIGSEILRMWQEADTKSTPAGIVAKDADILEMAITAREYMERGYKATQDWITTSAPRLHTTSAQNILALVLSTAPEQWWTGLKQF